jgi:hypothetical protein
VQSKAEESREEQRRADQTIEKQNRAEQSRGGKADQRRQN